MKKFLSIFALLMTMVIGAKAATETLFDASDDAWASATLTSGTTTVGNATFYGGKDVSLDAGKTIDGVTWGKRIKFGGGSTFQSGKDYARVLSVTVSSAGTLKVYFLTGSNGKSRSVYVSSAPSSTNRDTSTAVISASDDGAGNIASGAVTAGTYYIWCAENIGVLGVTLESSATEAPTITTDLPSTAEVTVGVAQEFSIEATGATSYQWYVGDEAVEGETSASFTYTASIEGSADIYCNAINSAGTTKSTVCSVLATMPASAPIITTDIETNYDVIKGKTLELSIVAEGAASYQWYLDNEPVEGATSASYTFTAGSTIGESRYIFCGATNAAGTTYSTVATVTTTGRSDCKLLQVKYSNNFYAFIKQPTTETPESPCTITSYYLEGEDTPTIESDGVTVSDGATWAIDGNTLTVTAEDGTTKADFTINAPVAVSPYTGSGEYTFTATDAWVKTGYSFDTTTGKKGWKFSKNDESDGKLRNADGRTRIYLFVGPCKTIKLTSGCSSDRDVIVYRNGTEVLAKTKLAKNGGTVTFDGDESYACMYELRSAQTGGDGSIEKITIETSTETIELDESGVATYVTKNALDFSTINGAFKAYIPTGITSKPSVATEEVTVVPAGTALLLKGAPGSYDVQIAESAETPAVNLFKVSDGNVRGDDNIYAYSKGDKVFKKVDVTINVPAGKCYLVIDDLGPGSLDVDFEDEATAINNVNANENAKSAAPVKVIKNGKLYIGNYNVAGARIK